MTEDCEITLAEIVVQRGKVSRLYSEAGRIKRKAAEEHEKYSAMLVCYDKQESKRRSEREPR